MTIDDIKSINLPITIDNTSALLVEAAIDWIGDNTTYTVDVTNIPANFRLFILKYAELMSISAGVASESIEGMSQSFESNQKEDILRQYARNLIGNYLKPDVKFFQAVRRW